MLPGRTEEYKYLDNAFKRDYSQIIVLYGKEGVGKSSLIKDFCKDKELVYFLSDNIIMIFCDNIVCHISI